MYIIGVRYVVEGFRLRDVKADLGRPVQSPRFHLGDEFLPGTVTSEGFVRVRRGEGELIPERLQAEVLVEPGLAVNP